MNEVWYLVIILMSSTFNSSAGVAVDHIPFSSQEACTKAKRTLQQAAPSEARFRCVKK